MQKAWILAESPSRIRCLDCGTSSAPPVRVSTCHENDSSSNWICQDVLQERKDRPAKGPATPRPDRRKNEHEHDEDGTLLLVPDLGSDPGTREAIQKAERLSKDFSTGEEQHTSRTLSLQLLQRNSEPERILFAALSGRLRPSPVFALADAYKGHFNVVHLSHGVFEPFFYPKKIKKKK